MKVFIFFLMLVIAPAQAAIKLQGLVLDANTHREIYGVNVFIEGTNIGATTTRGGTFVLDVPAKYAGAEIRFQHISYDVRIIPIDSLKSNATLYLVPRVIPLQDVQVVGESAVHALDIKRDLPQSVKVLQADKFDIRGYVDAGDFLNTEPAVQVQEELSGKKTLSMRGGNADDIVVLYNGVRMNSPFDNVFDFSLIDLANIERFEVIKGSNTTLYGPEAFSGVINIVPQVQRDYTLFTQYRMGTYNTESINLQLNKNINNLDVSYSYKDASQIRRFVDAVEKSDQLKNMQQHHNVNVNYKFGEAHVVNAMYAGADINYDNGRDNEKVGQKNDIASLAFSGAIGPVADVRLFSAFKQYDEQQNLNYGEYVLDRHIQDQSLQFKADKTFKKGGLEMLLGYSYEGSGVDFRDGRLQNERSLFYQQTNVDRARHGAFGILKTRGSAGGGFFQNFDLDGSLRYDHVNDRVAEPGEMPASPIAVPALPDQSWQAAHFKFSTSIDGYRDDFAFKGFFNYGANTKFPTVVQRLSVPLDSVNLNAPLQPERVSSYEAGVELFKEDVSSQVLDGWHAQGSFFRNYYTDKFRPFSSPGIPVVFYDNAPIAEIFGVEGNFSLYFLKKKVDLEFGLAKYNISEKSAFPFKSDFKRTVDLSIDHAGFSLMLHWFYESEQVGWIRTFSGQFAQVELAPFSNLDAHLSKSFRIGRAKLFLNLSMRNMLASESVALAGLAIRDKRAYLTFGGQL